MFNPKYQAVLKCASFHPDEFVCLGTQLVLIVNFIKDFLPQHQWYGADVDVMGKDISKYNVGSYHPSLLGTDSQFIEFCSQIHQFIWGDFLCIESSFSSQDLQGVELGTEDEPFRPLNCNGTLLEIRAFDTSYFEIYSEDLVLMQKFSTAFSVEIEEMKPRLVL